MADSNANPPEPKKSGRSIWPAVLLFICFTISAAAGALLASSGLFDIKKGTNFAITYKERVNTETELIKAKDKATVLIMGVDVRKDDVGRSDTMMIATIDPKLDMASLLSVPRDTRVRISGYGYDKINAAFAYGGEPLAEKTVENFLGIDIDHYIIINTRSFTKIIDAIGGIDIDVEKRMRYEDPWDDDGGLVINLYPGLQHMDGKTAVTYVRYRDSEGDIGRIKRQQAFMEACLDKVMSPEIIPRIPKIMREVVDAVDTDMTFRQLMELAGALKAAQKNGLATDMVPGYPIYIDEISYWIPDVEELQYAMAMGLGVSVDANLRRRVAKVADEYKSSIPSNAREIPEGADKIGTSSRDLNVSRDDSRNYDDYDHSRYDTTPSRDDYYNDVGKMTAREWLEENKPREDYYDDRDYEYADDRTYADERSYSDDYDSPAYDYRPVYEERRDTYYDDYPDYSDRADYYDETPRSEPNYDYYDDYEDDTPSREDDSRR